MNTKQECENVSSQIVQSPDKLKAVMPPAPSQQRSSGHIALPNPMQTMAHMQQQVESQKQDIIDEDQKLRQGQQRLEAFNKTEQVRLLFAAGKLAPLRVPRLVGAHTNAQVHGSSGS